MFIHNLCLIILGVLVLVPVIYLDSTRKELKRDANR